MDPSPDAVEAPPPPPGFALETSPPEAPPPPPGFSLEGSAPPAQASAPPPPPGFTLEQGPTGTEGGTPPEPSIHAQRLAAMGQQEIPDSGPLSIAADTAASTAGQLGQSFKNAWENPRESADAAAKTVRDSIVSPSGVGGPGEMLHGALTSLGVNPDVARPIGQATEGAAQTAGGLVTPTNVAIGAALAAFPAAAPAALAYFAATGAKDTAQQTAELIQKWPSLSQPEKAQAIGAVGGGALMTYLAGHGAAEMTNGATPGGEPTPEPASTHPDDAFHAENPPDAFQESTAPPRPVGVKEAPNNTAAEIEANRFNPLERIPNPESLSPEEVIAAHPELRGITPESIKEGLANVSASETVRLTDADGRVWIADLRTGDVTPGAAQPPEGHGNLEQGWAHGPEDPVDVENQLAAEQSYPRGNRFAVPEGTEGATDAGGDATQAGAVREPVPVDLGSEAGRAAADQAALQGGQGSVPDASEGAGESVGPFKSLGAGGEGDMDSPAFKAKVAQGIKDLTDALPNMATRAKNFLTNRGMRFTTGIDERAAQLLSSGNGAEADARLRVADLAKRADENGGAGAFEKSMASLVDSQVQGKVDQYGAFANEARTLSPDDLKTAFKDRYADALRSLQGVGPFAENEGLYGEASRFLKKGANAEAPEQLSLFDEADEMFKARDFSGLRKFLSDTFDKASQSLGEKVANSPDRALIDNWRRTPEHQAFLQDYQTNIGDKLQKLHEESGGRLLKYLGPDDTYLPLSVTKSETGPSAAWRNPTPYRTQTARNQFRTGFGDFTTDREALVKATADIIRKDSLDAGMDRLIKSGVMERVEDGKPAPPTMLLNGEEVPAVKETLADGTYIMPSDIHAELKPVFELGRAQDGIVKRLLDINTDLNLGGATDASYHISNQIGGMIRQSPAIALALLKHAAEDPEGFTHGFGNLIKDAVSKPTAPENIKYVRQAIEDGMVQGRYGRVSYGKEAAESVGGKTLMQTIKDAPGVWGTTKEIMHAAGPLISGANGMDMRGRVLLYKTLERLSPDASWSERVDYVRKNAGNYNQVLQGGMTRVAKQSGLAPFATAGRTFNSLGRTAVIPWMGLPGKGNAGLNLVGGGLTSIWGAAALWATAYHAMTGSDPITDKAKLWTLPIPQGIKDSALGRLMHLDEPGAMFNMNFIFPYAGRGAKGLGLEALYTGLQKGQGAGEISAEMGRQALNQAVQPFAGPAVHTAARVAGWDPGIGRTPPWESYGWQPYSALPQGTPPGSRFAETAKAIGASTNPLLEKARTGHLGSGVADSIVPRLIYRPFKPMKYKQPQEGAPE